MQKIKSIGQVECCCGVVLLFFLCSCAGIRITDPARTATEQFLLSTAITKAVDGLSFEPLYGRKVFLDSTNLTDTEKKFVLAQMRVSLLRSGIIIVPEHQEAEIIVEVRSGGIGVDRYENLLGIPAILAPSAGSSAGGAAAVPVITPELAITKKIKQISFASISYIAYWADTGEIFASFGPSVGKAYREDWWFMGSGPSTLGNIPPVDVKFDR